MRQLDAMSAKKGAAAAVGLGAASLLLANQADAATEAMQLAAGDNRFVILSTVVLIALGWVGECFRIYSVQDQGHGWQQSVDTARECLRYHHSSFITSHVQASTSWARPRASWMR